METEGRWAEEDRKALRDILDRHDMTIYTSKQDNELVSEIEFYSDLGEDFIMTFFWDGTAKGFTDGVQSYSEDFDPYEHACMYVGMSYSERKRLQVPDSNESLMKDALNIKKKLRRFARDLNKHFKGCNLKGA